MGFESRVGMKSGNFLPTPVRIFNSLCPTEAALDSGFGCHALLGSTSWVCAPRVPVPCPVPFPVWIKPGLSPDFSDGALSGTDGTWGDHPGLIPFCWQAGMVTPGCRDGVLIPLLSLSDPWSSFPAGIPKATWMGDRWSVWPLMGRDGVAGIWSWDGMSPQSSTKDPTPGSRTHVGD